MHKNLYSKSVWVLTQQGDYKTLQKNNTDLVIQTESRPISNADPDPTSF